jgi:hypothetical protein
VGVCFFIDRLSGGSSVSQSQQLSSVWILLSKYMPTPCACICLFACMLLCISFYMAALCMPAAVWSCNRCVASCLHKTLSTEALPEQF